jgi:hypothetical protein
MVSGEKKTQVVFFPSTQEGRIFFLLVCLTKKRRKPSFSVNPRRGDFFPSGLSDEKRRKPTFFRQPKKRGIFFLLPSFFRQPKGGFFFLFRLRVQETISCTKKRQDELKFWGTFVQRKQVFKFCLVP